MKNIFRSIKISLEYFRYKFYLLLNKPYFGIYLAARQGDPSRLYYIDKIIQQILPKSDPISILEIGSWAGSSAIAWAAALKKYHFGNGKIVCIDAWKSYFDLQENKENVYLDMNQAAGDDKIFKLFLHNIKATKNDHIITYLRGQSCDILPSLTGIKFDIIYIDASHLYPDVLSDIKFSKNLLKDPGVLCGDDLELQISEIDLEFAKKNKTKDYILDPRTKRLYHPGVTLAVGEIFNKVSSWDGFWAMKKNVAEWELLVLKNES